MKSCFCAFALSVFAAIVAAGENSLDWPMTVENSKGEKAFTVECSADNGVPTVTIKRLDGTVVGSMTAVSKYESCQGEFAQRALASIGKMVATDFLK